MFICFFEYLLKMMENYFYFILKALFILKIFNCKIHDVTTWLTINYNTYIAQYLAKLDKQTMKLGQLIEYSKRNSFLEKSCRK